MTIKYEAMARLGDLFGPPKLAIYGSSKKSEGTIFVADSSGKYSLGQNCVQAVGNYQSGQTYNGFEMKPANQR